MAQTLDLGPAVSAALRANLSATTDQVLEVIMAEVPAYTNAWQGSMGQTIARAVRTALDGFITIASQSGGDEVVPMGVAVEGAYELGRGEARSGRSADALLAAYRIGARVSWHELSRHAVEHGLPAAEVARFAELVFAYIDELSAASVAGHTDEVATTGRVRQARLDRLTRLLLSGAATNVLLAAAESADWAPPRTLTAVLIAPAQARAVLAAIDERALQGEATGEGNLELAVLLVPDVSRARRGLVRTLAGRGAVVGPTVEWEGARTSYLRAMRAWELRSGTVTLDTEEHLAALVLGADGDALADLRARALAPLGDLKPMARQKLTETLRSWLLHLGRREAVAEDLFVHPQTVRYRMGQVRELYGDRLDDPLWVRDLVVALA